MPIDVPRKLRDQRGELRPLGGGVQIACGVQIQKQLGKEMGQKPQKDLLATAQMVCLDQSVILDILVRYWLHSGKHTSKRSTNSTQLPFSKSILAILPRTTAHSCKPVDPRQNGCLLPFAPCSQYSLTKAGVRPFCPVHPRQTILPSPCPFKPPYPARNAHIPLLATPACPNLPRFEKAIRA